MSGRACAAAFVMLLVACQASVSPGAQCTRASDCTSPLVCAIGRCRVACADSRDCPTLARCIVEPSSGTHVCSLARTDDCVAHDCPLGFVCRDGQCLNACGSIVSCPDGVCDGDACLASRLGPIDAGPSDAPAVTTWTITITDDADDGELWIDRVYVDGESNDTDFAGYWAPAATHAFARFTLPGAIPAGAHVVDARIHVRALGTVGLVSDAGHLAVVFDDVSDAPAVTQATDFAGGPTGLAPTSASAAWGALTAWPTAGESVSPDLSALLQELVDHHGGLAAGAHVRVWITAGDYMTDGEVAWQDSNVGAGGPSLVVRWSH